MHNWDEINMDNIIVARLWISTVMKLLNLNIIINCNITMHKIVNTINIIYL